MTVFLFLHFSGADSYNGQAFYGAGASSMPIFLDDLRCTSDSANLDACDGWSWGTHNCVHNEDAGVSCTVDDTSDENSNGGE